MLPATLVVRKQKLVRISLSCPISPDRTASCTVRVSGWDRYMNPSTSARPSLRATSNISSASAALAASGFSHRTCFPARRLRTVHSWCNEFGSDTYTASTAGSAIRASYDPWARGRRCAAANCSALWTLRDPTADKTLRLPGAWPRVNCLAILPVPRMPQRSIPAIYSCLRWAGRIRARTRTAKSNAPNRAAASHRASVSDTL